MPPPDIVFDPERLAALADYEILDTLPEQGFDDLVRLATRLCDAPTALVSLVADNRQWFKARIGFPECETDLNSSVCAYVLTEPDLLVIPDLSQDVRTASNPLVTGEPHIRFYAGAPLRSPDGHVLGSLCVIDTVARPQGLSPDQAQDLRALANQVMIHLSMRRAAAHRDELLQQQSTTLFSLARTEEQLRLAVEATQIGIFDFDLLTGELRWDSRVRELFGVPSDAPVTYENTFLPGVHPDDRQSADEAVQRALDPNGSGTFDTEYRTVSPDGKVERWLGAKGQSFVEGGRVVRFIGTVRDITNRRRAELVLQETEERYRLAARATNDAIWDWDLISNHVRWNDALATVHGHLGDAVEPTGEWWIDHIHPDDRERVAHGIHDVIDGAGDVWTDTYRFKNADGSYADILDRGFVIRNDRRVAVRMIGAMLDRTEHTESVARKQALVELGERLRDMTHQKDMIRAASEIVGKTLGATRAGFGYVSDSFEDIEILDDWTADGVASLVGVHEFATYGRLTEQLRLGQPLVVADVQADARANSDALLHIGVRSMINATIRDRDSAVALIFVHDDHPRSWSDEVLTFLRNVGDRLEAGIARLRAEEQQRILNEELSHRMKNTMAMIQAIASQTMREVPDQAPVEAFNKRLLALSSAHDVLLKQSWMAARVIEVTKAVLGTFGLSERFFVSGPNIEFGARATLSLSLLLHELATNATKYGALSNSTGEVHITWQINRVDDQDQLVLHWKEEGGPPPREPDQKGFGSRLIKMGLIGTGQVELRYPKSGFEADFSASLNQVRS